jgi:serine/threonine-protein kinase
LWALSLHPDERPQSVEQFRQALVGDVNPVTQPRKSMPRPTLADLVASPADRILVALVIGVILISFFVTLLR